MTPDHDDEWDGPWCVAQCECRICGHTQVGVFPSCADEDNLECGNCGHMTCEAVAAEEE